MSEEYRCSKEAMLGEMKADTRILMSDLVKTDERFKTLEKRMDDLSTISTAVSVMSVSLKHIVEHNHKQDLLMKDQGDILSKINDNLSKLNQGQLLLDKKVESLEKRVDENENLNRIDLRKLRQDASMSALRKYGIPVGLGATAAAIILELLKLIK